MRRLGATFITVWVGLFVPSLIIWGLMLRWSSAGADRFESIWRWTADRLAFPLLFEEQIEWSWLALETGSVLRATVGFVFLTALWAVMFALPLAVIGAWWVWMIGRGGDSVGIIDSPGGAIYLITIPLALIWALLRALISPFTGETHPVVRFFIPVLMVAGAVFAVVVVWLSVAFAQAGRNDWLLLLNQLGSDMWFGYLQTLKIPAIFESCWFDAWAGTEASTFGLTRQEWQAYRSEWYRQSDLRALIGIAAARHALGAAMVATVIQSVRYLFMKGE